MTWSSFAWRIGLLLRIHRRRLLVGWRLWRRRRRRHAPSLAPTFPHHPCSTIPGAPIAIMSPFYLHSIRMQHLAREETLEIEKHDPRDVLGEEARQWKRVMGAQWPLT